jgi:hypothetical protein
VVVDGTESEAYDGLVNGSRIVFDAPDSLYFLALREGRTVYRVVVRLQ